MQRIVPVAALSGVVVLALAGAWLNSGMVDNPEADPPAGEADTVQVIAPLVRQPSRLRSQVHEYARGDAGQTLTLAHLEGASLLGIARELDIIRNTMRRYAYGRRPPANRPPVRSGKSETQPVAEYAGLHFPWPLTTDIFAERRRGWWVNLHRR